jgi:hypothetical protein
VVVGLGNPPAVSWQGALNTQGETAELNFTGVQGPHPGGSR